LSPFRRWTLGFRRHRYYIAEMRASNTSERQGRLINHAEVGSMARKKREGHF
jgi:hypothetical protein